MPIARSATPPGRVEMAAHPALGPPVEEPEADDITPTISSMISRSGRTCTLAGVSTLQDNPRAR